MYLLKVQGTNDSSILSKVSMVKLGYFDDLFLREFVDKDVRRSPSINRFEIEKNIFYLD
jgi:tRNA wybutosine-synthesizing protein 4